MLDTVFMTLAASYLEGLDHLSPFLLDIFDITSTQFVHLQWSHEDHPIEVEGKEM